MYARRILLVLVIVLILWIGMDLLITTKSDIRRFDPALVARLDTEMWRSYYDNRQLKLFSQLATLMRGIYEASFWQSQLMAFHAAKAAFLFKKGKVRADYEKALPALRNYYGAINRISQAPFNVEEAARLELEWWIVHRHNSQEQLDDLQHALAASAASVYGVSLDQLKNYARFRAEAMKIRDDQAAEQSLTAKDWDRINLLLDESWQSLHDAVNTE